MQSIGGIINDIIILGIFIYLVMLVNGKTKLPGSAQEKFDALMARNGTLLKILAYTGTILLILIIAINFVKK
ncbi:MAG TPA: hypothetical protein VG847_13295 [Chitinophagaceae bacterium]|nr:hypothetical protein [Chitinophagaceae bacterium]